MVNEMATVMHMLSIAGQLQGEDLEIAIMSLTLELEDIEDLEGAATGDGAEALRLQKIEFHRYLLYLTNRQMSLRRNPRPNLRHVANAAPASRLIRTYGPFISPPMQALNHPNGVAAPVQVASPARPDMTIQTSGSRSPIPNFFEHTPAASAEPSMQSEMSRVEATTVDSDPLTTPVLPKSSIHAETLEKDTARTILSTPFNLSNASTPALVGRSTDSESTKASPSAAAAAAQPTSSMTAAVLKTSDEMTKDSTALWEDLSSEGSESRSAGSVTPDEHFGSGSPTQLSVARIPSIDANILISCPICLEDDVGDLVKSGCEHEYCSTCIQRVFTDACNNESRFPPRCCGPFALPEVERFLTPELVDLFHAKEEEFGTKNRTYCHDIQCAAFIPPSNISVHEGTCGKCRKLTCTMCKVASHGGDCPQDEGLEQVLRLGKRLGWQRCRECDSMVSITTGCNDMRCGARWCYQCRAPHNSCNCRTTQEQLIARQSTAAQIVDLEALERADAASANAGSLANARAVGPCVEHPDPAWRYNRGGGQCVGCREHMPDFTYVCSVCSYRYCRRCSGVERAFL